MAKAKPRTAYNVAGIPAEMGLAPRWVNWQAVERDGKWTKVPLCPRGGPAKSNDPTTWGTFAEATKTGHGVGFMLGDGWLGVDLDGVIVDGQLQDEWIRDWVAGCGTYVEESPSGTGLHAIFRGVTRTPGTANRKGNVEVYDGLRFFCITGKVPTPDRRGIGSSQTAVDALSRRFLTEERPEARRVAEGPTRDPSADDWYHCRKWAQMGLQVGEMAEHLRAKMRDEGRDEKRERPDYVVGTVQKAFARFGRPPAQPVEVLSLTQALTMFPERAPYVVHNFIRQGEVGALIAAPKSRKSWVMADLAVCVATAMPWFNRFPCVKGRVLLVDNELQPGDLAARLRSVCQGHGFSPTEVADRIDVLSLRENEVPIDEILRQMQDREPYALTIWDALYMMLLDDMDENKNSDMARLLRLFRRFATRTKAATIFVHHTAKGGGRDRKSIDAGAGAGVIGRAPDSHMTLIECDDDEDAYRIQFSLRSSQRPVPFEVKWNERLWRYEQHFTEVDVFDPEPKKAKKPRK